MPGPLVSQAAIKKAYRSKSLEFHPDKCEGDKAGFLVLGMFFFGGGLFFFEDFQVVFFCVLFPVEICCWFVSSVTSPDRCLRSLHLGMKWGSSGWVAVYIFLDIHPCCLKALTL